MFGRKRPDKADYESRQSEFRYHVVLKIFEHLDEKDRKRVDRFLKSRRVGKDGIKLYDGRVVSLITLARNLEFIGNFKKYLDFSDLEDLLGTSQKEPQCEDSEGELRVFDRVAMKAQIQDRVSYAIRKALGEDVEDEQEGGPLN